MNDERVVIETPCGHGEVYVHGRKGTVRDVFTGGTKLGWVDRCPGGVRRTLTPGEYVLIEKVAGEWPELEALIVDGTLDFTNGSRILDALASVAGKNEA